MGCRRWGVDHFLLSAPLPTNRYPISGGRGRKKRYSLPSFFWLIDFGQLPDEMFNLTLPPDLFWIWFFLAILRGILRTRNKFAFWWQPIVRFLFIFLFLDNEYFCAHPIFAFYHLPYPSLSILPPSSNGNDIEISWIFTQR